MECAYKDGAVLNRGRRMNIRAGEMIGAIAWLAARWNWSPMAVRWFLNTLEDEGMIERPKPNVKIETCTPLLSNTNVSVAQKQQKNNKHSGNQISVLKVCKYGLYQFIKRLEQQAQQQAHNKRTTSAQQESNKVTSKQEDSVPSEQRADALELQAEKNTPKDKEVDPWEEQRVAIWRGGIKWLCSVYTTVPEPALRSQVGKILKEAGNNAGLVHFAMGEAYKAKSPDPLNYIREVVNRAGRSFHGQQTAFQRQSPAERMAEARAILMGGSKDDQGA